MRMDAASEHVEFANAPVGNQTIQQRRITIAPEMNRPMIIAAGYVVIIVAALLTFIWTMQRRFIYFPTGDVPTPGEIGLAGVEPVTFDTSDGLA